MIASVLVTLLALQAPVLDPIRVPAPPPAAVPAARETLMGLRLIDVRPDGAYLLGSACPTAPFEAYTANHVIAEVKGELFALPTHGRLSDISTASRVSIVWKDEKKDLAVIRPVSGVDAFLHWYKRGSVPVAGAEVRGTLLLPGGQNPAVPTFGTYYGENEGDHWTSLMIGPGSSGSCVLDDQDRAWGIAVSIAVWGTTTATSHSTVVAQLPEAKP